MLLLTAALVFTAVLLAGEAVTAPARARRTSLQRALETGRRAADAPDDAQPFRERVVAPVAARLASAALRVSPRTSRTAVAQRLLAAGMTRVAPTSFLAAKAGLALGGGAFGMLLGGSASPMLGILFGGALAFGGFRMPDILVSSRARKRGEQIRAQLPDALELLAVSVEAGLGFDAAATRLTEHMKGPLVDELALALNEMRIGRSRHEALRSISDRVGVPEVAAFVRAVVQADQLGLSLSRVLKVQADDVRQRRQTAAEEKAMKAPIKMLFPTVLFIFPAMFVVILGPALLSFSKVF